MGGYVGDSLKQAGAFFSLFKNDGVHGPLREGHLPSTRKGLLCSLAAGIKVRANDSHAAEIRAAGTKGMGRVRHDPRTAVYSTGPCLSSLWTAMNMQL